MTGRRDYYAGGLMALIGLLAAAEGRTYRIGTLLEMGPGFFPVAVGVALVVVGLLIAVNGATLARSAESGDQGHGPVQLPDWRGGLCISCGIVAFIILGDTVGMIPAAFACVFIAALGDRSSTWKGALALAVCISAAGALLFAYALKINMPLVRGW